MFSEWRRLEISTSSGYFAWAKKSIMLFRLFCAITCPDLSMKMDYAQLFVL